MGRLISKNGKVVRCAREAAAYVRDRKSFCGALVDMMDGGKGRRYMGQWQVTYSDDPTLPALTPAVRTYTVYSYGNHYPMYVWDDLAQQWYGNRDKFSRTTTKHMGIMCPCPRSQIVYFGTDTLKDIARRGVAGWVKDKMGNSHVA